MAAYWEGHSDILTGPIREPLLVPGPGACVRRFDATHLLRPKPEQLRAEAEMKRRRDAQIREAI